MFNNAFAMAPAGGAGGSQNMFGAILPIVLMFLVFYFLLIRPQQKKSKDHQKFLDSLQKGDDVITSSGIYGKIVGTTEKVITLEIADGIKVKMARGYVLGKKELETESNKT